MARVLEKVNETREDLGSVVELFDAAFQRRMMELNDDKDVLADLDREIATRQHATDDARVVTAERGTEDRARLERLLADLDLTPLTLQDTLRVALGLGSAQEPLQGPDARGRMRLRTPLPARWQAVADDSLRLRGDRGVAGAMPWLVFDNRYFIHTVNGRSVFRPSPDTVLMHLGHPVMRQVLTSFARLRFPGGQSEFAPPSRWVVTRGGVPANADALILVTIEELGINALRETLHHWVRTVALPVTVASSARCCPMLVRSRVAGLHGGPGRCGRRARSGRARDRCQNLAHQLSCAADDYPREGVENRWRSRNRTRERRLRTSHPRSGRSSA